MVLRALFVGGALAAGPAAAQDAVTWLGGGTALPLSEVSVGDWHPPGGEIHATDPLTLFQTGPEAQTLNVPDAPARVVGFRYDAVLNDRVVDSRTAILALIWSDAPVTCGRDLATVAVDSGLASFIAPSQVPALFAYEDRYGPSFVRAVPGPLQRQIEDQSHGPLIADLPGDLSFPISDAGWGDGAYPVASLHDAAGDLVALYAQFITAEGEDWLLPPPCD